MTERILAVDEAVALAEAPAMQIDMPVRAEKKPNAEKTPLKLCVSVQKEWFPVCLPNGADVEYLRRVTGSKSISELQFDRAGQVYEPAEKLQENHVYELFCPEKTRFNYFLNEFRIIQ